MTRRTDRPAAVRAGPDGEPQAVRWRGRWLPVDQVLEAWVYSEPWWAAGEPGERRVFRLLVGGRVLEVAHGPGDGWRLYRIYD